MSTAPRVYEVQLKKGYFERLFEWPDALRYRGSVIPRIVAPVTLMVLFTALIAFLYIDLNWTKLSLPNSVVPSLSVVLGLLLAFRTNTAYDRFWEGRKLFQTLTSAVRNVCRTVWISVPEDSQLSHDEKMACIKLLVAFVVATKHHLREEFGTDYYDLDVLLPKNWIPAAAGPDIRVVSNPSQPPLSAPAGAGQAALASQNAHPDTAPQGGGGDNPNDPVNMPIGSHEAQVSAAYRDREDLPDESDSDMSLPMEILFRIGLYVAQSRARPANEKPMDPNTANTIMGGLSILTDCLGCFERILYTPIPKAYTIHLKQAIYLYILALPFTLVKELNWFVVPMVGLVSFTLLGIEGIGSEIENPFGYDANDLPLNQYCEEIKKEVEYIIYHVPSRSRSILLEGR